MGDYITCFSSFNYDIRKFHAHSNITNDGERVRYFKITIELHYYGLFGHCYFFYPNCWVSIGSVWKEKNHCTSTDYNWNRWVNSGLGILENGKSIYVYYSR